MNSPACQMVQDELMFLGDILCMGIIRKGLEKVGSSPDIATPNDLTKAIDAHIEPALVTFIGPSEAHKRGLRIKGLLAKLNGGSGA